MQLCFLFLLVACIAAQPSGTFSLYYCGACTDLDGFLKAQPNAKVQINNIPDDSHELDKNYLSHFFLKLEGDEFNTNGEKRWTIISSVHNPSQMRSLFLNVESELEFKNSAAQIDFFAGTGFMFYYASEITSVQILPVGMTPNIFYGYETPTSDTEPTEPAKYYKPDGIFHVKSMYFILQKMLAAQTNPLTQEEYEKTYVPLFKKTLPTMTYPNACYSSASSAHFGVVPYEFDVPWNINQIGIGVLPDDGSFDEKQPFFHIRVVPTTIPDEIKKNCPDDENEEKKDNTRQKSRREDKNNDIDPEKPVDLFCDPLAPFVTLTSAFKWDYAIVLKYCFANSAGSTTPGRKPTQYLKTDSEYKLSLIVFYATFNTDPETFPELNLDHNFEEPDADYFFRTSEYACGDNLDCVERQGVCNFGLAVCECFPDFDGFLCDHRKNLSPAIIAVIAICSILFIALIAGGIGVFVFKRRLRAKRKITLTAPDFEKLKFASVKKPEYPPEVSSRFRQDVIEQLIINDEPGMLILWEVCKLTPVTDSDNLAKSLVYGFERHSKSLTLIMFLITKEVQESEEDPDTLFRANSFATKTFKFYSKMIGLPYLFRTIAVLLQGMLRDLADQEQSSKVENQSDVKLFKVEVELDPEKMDNSGDENINVLMLQLTCQKFLVQILRSAGDCPGEFKQLCAHIKSVVEQRFPGYVYKAIGAFMFLRFFNTGITVPETYGLMTTPPAPTARRQLILLSKVLQNLANGVKFGAKESFMTKLNSFISANQDKLKGFYDRLCDESAFAGEKVTVPDSIYNPSIAHIYNQCANASLTNDEIFSSFPELSQMLSDCTDPNQIVHESFEDPIDEENPQNIN